MTTTFGEPSGLGSLRPWVVGLTLPLVGIAVLATSQGNGPTLCAVRVCTGHACPGCGMTRAIGAAVQGDLALSWRYHPLALLVAAQVLVAWLALVFVGRPDRLRPWLLPMIAANAGLLLLTWLIRWRLGHLDFVIAGG